MNALSPIPYNAYSLQISSKVNKEANYANLPPPEIIIEPPSNTGVLVIKFTQPVLMPDNILELTSESTNEYNRDLQSCEGDSCSNKPIIRIDYTPSLRT